MQYCVTGQVDQNFLTYCSVYITRVKQSSAILNCRTLKIKKPWSFKMSETNYPMTEHHVPETSIFCNTAVRTSNFITLIDFQLDAQNSYLFIYNTFIKILYMFWALPCSSWGGLRRNCIHAASGIVTLCRWLSCAPVKKNTCRQWRYQRLHVYDYDVDLLKMSRVMLETCRGF